MSAIDAALERLRDRGPEFRGGLSNHGPMAAEALVSLGRPEAVEDWVEGYRPVLLEHPPRRERIDPVRWHEAIGDYSRVTDWEEFFSEELRQHPWPAVLETWLPRLAPGLLAGGTHGLIRTAHAVRTLESGVSPLRLGELASGLAYSAARYLPLHGNFPAPASISPEDPFAALPVVAVEDRPHGLLITAHLAALDAAGRLPAAPEAVPADPSALISGLTSAGAAAYLQSAETAPIALIHAVTAPSAVRMLLPHLSSQATQPVLAAVWQACAALYCGYLSPTPAPPPPPPVTDLADFASRAVDARDEHTIKFTEACLREHAISPNPAYLAAATDATIRLRR